MNDTITFLHAADLHLDSPFKGFSDVPERVFETMRESTFQAFNQLIQTAIEKKVDFILLAGDLFDEKKQSLKAQLHLRDGFLRLQQHHIDVFLSYGNHDYMEGNAYPITYPSNVYIFPDEQVTSFPYIKNDQTIANIYGFSYVKRDVKENKAKQFTIKHNEAIYHIAMLHGSLHGDQDHDPYAPFRLEDLQREPFDYWALGHIHKRAIIQEKPPIVYPGNIQGRHRKESGAKGCYYIEMNQMETTKQFIPLQHVNIVDEQIDITEVKAITEVEQTIMKKLTGNEAERRLIYITFMTNEEQLSTLGLKERLQDLIDVINETLLMDSHWQYIFNYSITVLDEGKVNVDTFFMEEINEAVETIDVVKTIDDLYRHPQAKKQLQMIDESDIIERAIQYITDEMSKKVR